MWVDHVRSEGARDWKLVSRGTSGEAVGRLGEEKVGVMAGSLHMVHEGARGMDHMRSEWHMTGASVTWGLQGRRQG